MPNPAAEAERTRATGHAEVLKFEFDPGQLDYAEPLRVVFTLHDPATLNRQDAKVAKFRKGFADRVRSAMA